MSGTNGSTSPAVEVISGVPQGSILGPALLPLWTGWIAQLSLSITVTIGMFADEIVLYKPAYL